MTESAVLPTWLSRSAVTASELASGANALRTQLSEVDRECFGLQEQLARRRVPPAAAGGTHPSELANELLKAARQAQGRLDPVDAQCTDLAIKADRVREHTYATASPDRRAKLRAELEQSASLIRSELDAVERECIGLRTQVERLRRQGRSDHIAANRGRAAAPLSDVPGYGDLRPEPLAAHTAAEFVAALRQFRIWSGEPSFRTMASRSRRPASTLAAALNADALPPMETMIAIITGCNGSIEDQREYTTAWRQIRLGRASHKEDSPPIS
jgi:hypothetical protein